MNKIKAMAFLLALFAILNLLMLSVAGCSQNVSSEEVSFEIVDSELVGIQYSSEVKQDLFLYYTQTKQIEHVTPFSSTCVGDIKSYPDPCSVESFGKGLIEGIKMF